VETTIGSAASHDSFFDFLGISVFVSPLRQGKMGLNPRFGHSFRFFHEWGGTNEIPIGANFRL